MPSTAPPAAWLAVSVKSVTTWSLIHTVTCGTSPSMRARIVFHASRFHAFCHASFRPRYSARRFARSSGVNVFIGGPPTPVSRSP